MSEPETGTTLFPCAEGEPCRQQAREKETENEMAVSISETVRDAVESIKAVSGQELSSCKIKGEWDDSVAAPKGRFEITCDVWCSKKEWIELVCNVFPYVAIIAIAITVGCCLCRGKHDTPGKKNDSIAQVKNVEASASVRFNKDVEK